MFFVRRAGLAEKTFALVWLSRNFRNYYDLKCGNRGNEPATHFAFVRIFGIRFDIFEKVEENALEMKSQQPKYHTKNPANNVADTRREHSLRHGQTIDTLTIAKFVLHEEIPGLFFTSI